MAAAYDRAPDLDSNLPDRPTLEPAVALLVEAPGTPRDTPDLSPEPTLDQRERLGHAATTRSLDEFAGENGLPLLARHGLIRSDRHTQPLLHAIGEMGVSNYEAGLDELAQPLPDLNAARLMPEPPIAAWEQRRLEQELHLDAILAAMYPSTPWQRQAYDRRKAWQEIDESPLGRVRFWREHENGATMGMAWDSIRFLAETHTCHAFGSIASALRHSGKRVAEGFEEFPYTSVAWADRQLTHLENVVYGLGRVIGSQARRIGETRSWQATAEAASSATTYALYGAVMGYAFTGLFLTDPMHYLKSAAHGAWHLPSRALRGVLTLSTTHRAAAGVRSAPVGASEAGQPESNDEQLITLMQRQGLRTTFTRSDLPGEPLSKSESHFAEEAQPLIAAHLLAMDKDDRLRIWITAHDVTAQAMKRVPGACTASPAEARDVYRSLREMFPAVDEALSQANLDMQAITAEVLKRLKVSTIDSGRRLDVFTVMADFFSQVEVNSPQPGV